MIINATKNFLLAATVLLACAAHAQTRLAWSTPVPVAGSAYGFTRPHVILCNGVTVVVWSDFNAARTYASRFVGGAFTTPVPVSPQGFSSQAMEWTGPDLAVHGNTLYVSLFEANTGHSYVVRSDDGGATFGDTARTDVGEIASYYPTVNVMPDGNPIVMYKRFNSTAARYEFVVRRSTDGGHTFSTPVSATALIADQPCDCCPGVLIASDSAVVMAYRNNNSNIRDIWTSVSTDGGNTFNAPERVDSSNWYILQCPSSGPTAYLNGNRFYAAFMNGVSGTGKVYTAEINTSTLQVHGDSAVTGGTGQNFPRMSGEGDTVAIVWHELVNGNFEIVFAHSFNGIANIGVTADTLTLGLPDAQSYADVTCSGGFVHLVFHDVDNDRDMYMYASLSSVADVKDVTKPQPFTALVTDHQINVTTNTSIGACRLTLLSVDGRVISEQQLSGLNIGQTVALNKPSSAGMYLLVMTSGHQTRSEKIIVGQ